MTAWLADARSSSSSSLDEEHPTYPEAMTDEEIKTKQRFLMTFPPEVASWTASRTAGRGNGENRDRCGHKMG
jgi:hypothetical protein